MGEQTCAGLVNPHWQNWNTLSSHLEGGKYLRYLFEEFALSVRSRLVMAIKNEDGLLVPRTEMPMQVGGDFSTKGGTNT